MSDLDDPYKSFENGSNRLEASHFQQTRPLYGFPSFDCDTNLLLSLPSPPVQENSPKNIDIVQTNVGLSPNCSFSPDLSVKLEVDPNLHAYTTRNTATDARPPVFTRPPVPQHPMLEENCFMPKISRSRSSSVHSQVSSACSEDISNALFASDSSDQGDTPPLTPDSLGLLSFSSSIRSQPQPSDSLRYPSDDDLSLRDRAHALEIKEGKRPERPICYDTLIDDITEAPTFANVGYDSFDQDEWYGLEYTLQLSCREYQTSEMHLLSGGEHSKSRESWAAIHLGAVHPSYEEEEFSLWKRWHHFLDTQEQKRKEHRTLEFLVQSRDDAWLFKEEVKLTRMYLWQKQFYGDVSRDVKDRLILISEYRPDPYRYPRHRVMNRSRSVSCLCELYHDH